MTYKNGAHYDSNYARAAAYFLSTCAPKPDGEAELSAYTLITGIYEAIGRDPSAIGYKPTEDLWFEPWEPQRGREKDVKNIREPIAKIEKLIKELFDAVEIGEATDAGLVFSAGSPSSALSLALKQASYTLEKNPQTILRLPRGCAAALKKLCALSRENTVPITDGPLDDKAFLFFSRCVFDVSDNWTAKAFDAAIDGGGLIVKLCAELERRGYTRTDCRDGKKISLDYSKQHGKKAEPVKAAWGERSHSGIELSYEELRLEPCFLWMRMPMFKTVLEKADSLPSEVAEFIASNTKTCDGCRYCVQTDKTKTRPLAAVKLSGKNKCPMFPGFTFNWRRIDGELCEKILKTLDAVDALFD